MNATTARAFALTRRPVGKTAHKSIYGSVHSCSTARTTPRSSSGANIHCDAIASPRSASTEVTGGGRERSCLDDAYEDPHGGESIHPIPSRNRAYRGDRTTVTGRKERR
jgi:hypothetical protein